MNRLLEFLEKVDARIDSAVADPSFHPAQRELLQQSATLYRSLARANPLGEPIALLYLVASAWGRELDEQAERVAAFCALYILAADLLDDVQDDDLSGKPHQDVGIPIAANSAVTLLFLALRELHESLQLEPDAARRSEYLELFNRVSIQAVAGQHRDLMGIQGAATPEQVLRMQQAKTSSVSLLTECGALLARTDPRSAEHYRALGEQMALLVQVRDDLRDIFGKTISPDLNATKMTYPVACYLQSASPSEVTEFERLVAGLPETLGQIRELLYASGAVASSALELERCRQSIHHGVATLGNDSPAHRTLLDMADAIAETVYTPPPLEVSSHLWIPEGVFHTTVRRELSLFGQRMKAFRLPDPPRLRPWHQSQWMYDSERRTVFYPDVEGQAEDILPFQAALLGTEDLDDVARVMREQIPAVLAHEMFHFWRDEAGRLTRDHWHEEWAANRLAVAYLRQFAPETLQASLSLAARVLDRFPAAIDERAERILDRSPHECPEARGYELDLVGTALVGLEMVRRLAQRDESFERVFASLLAQGREAGCAA